MNKEEIINKLKLVPLEQEGGWVRELYRGENDSYGTIYYLLDEDSCSRMHSLKHDEIWYYHDGPALTMYLIHEDHDEIRCLGKDILNGEEPQIRVPAGTFMGAVQKEKGGCTLTSTSMTPAYDPSEFRLGSCEELESRSCHKDLLKKLCK